MQQPLPTNVDLKDTTEVLCGCGHNEFAPVYKVKKLSKILSPTGKDEYVQLVEIRCIKCQKPLGDTLKEDQNPETPEA